MDEPTAIKPQEGPQTAFLASGADICIYGGAAGGGKTWGLLMEPLRHIHNRHFGAVVFRRTYPEITLEGGMWDESRKLYPLLGARSNETELQWRFPSGARVTFSHMQREQDKERWKGAQVPLPCFDQLESFSEGQFFYMLSRNRSTCGVRPYVRATCNPDAESWLAGFLEWWIDEDGYASLERAGRMRWFVRIDERIVWADSREELVGLYPDVPAKSVTFIPASIYDNRILLKQNPDYLANLKALPLVDRERLLGDAKRGGNWKIKPAAGKVFNRGWFEVVPAAPAGGVECRFWDFAATERKMSGEDPDATAGVDMRLVGGIWYVLDCIEERLGPAQVDRLFVNRSRQDAQAAAQASARYRVRWEIEPGAAAIQENRRLVGLLAGMDAKGIRPQGDKIQRAKGLAAQSEAGNVKLVMGPWNEVWLNHMHNQPDWPHDDIMDASSGAFNSLTPGAAREATSYQG